MYSLYTNETNLQLRVRPTAENVNQKKKELDELINEKISKQKEAIGLSYNHQLLDLRLDVERAEGHAKSARWIAISTVIVTIVLAIILLV